MGPPRTPSLRTERLVLTPLEPADAAEMLEVLADPDLYAFTGGGPPTLEELESRYRAQAAGPAAGDQAWHNWILRLAASGTAVGFVQATVTGDTADLAWVVGTAWQRRGLATEAASAMAAWLAAERVERFTAHIRPGHEASGRVARAVGLQPTGEVDAEGEEVWASPAG